jgi:hypothetical protein
MTESGPPPGEPPRPDPPADEPPAPAPPSYEAPHTSYAQAAPPPPPPLPSGNDPYRSDEAKRLGWNWGAFLLPYLWLIGHGRVTLGLLLALSWTIPLVGWLNFLAYPVIGIYLGLNGFELAWRHQPYHDVEQLATREREWAVWGFIGIILLLVGAAFFMAFVAPIYRDVLSSMEGYGW